MSERLDIRSEMRALCQKLGIDYEATVYVVFRPEEVEATVLRRNEQGNFYAVHGEGAADILRFKVST